jgi:hypothetical protein
MLPPVGCVHQPVASGVPPTALVSRAAVRRWYGPVRIQVYEASQDVIVRLRIVQDGGRTLAQLSAPAYGCVSAGAAPQPITASATRYGRAVMRRHATLPATVELRLVNGSEVATRVRQRVAIARERRDRCNDTAACAPTAR